MHRFKGWIIHKKLRCIHQVATCIAGDHVHCLQQRRGGAEFQMANVAPVEVTWLLRVVVSLACLLSIIGSLLIISTYFIFKQLRTTPRLILVHLSIMDAGVATANLVGAVVDFNQYYYTDQFLPNGYPLANNVSSVIQSACVAQATFAVYCTSGSFVWTLGMALYLYMRMVHHE